MRDEFPIEITGKAFLLRPDIPPEGRPRPQSADGSDDNELREPLRTHATELGLTKMKRPPTTSYTLPALEATEYAAEQGKFEEFHKACYRAYWEEMQDIGKLEVLESIARDCGLDWPELEERLKSEYYRQEVLTQYLMGRKIGFQGIPGFIIGNNKFTGAAPYEVFQTAANRAMAAITSDAPSPTEE